MNYTVERLEQLARDALTQSGRACDADVLRTDKSLIADYGFDSVALINLLMSIEGAFNIQIREEDLNTDNFDTIGTIQALLEEEYAVGAD